MSDLGLRDRVILVTGAGRGLGKTYAALLAKHGANVVVHDGGLDEDGGNPDPSVAESVADDIRANGGSALPITELLHDSESCRHIVAAAVDHFGRLDGLIHSAGLVDRHDPPEVDEEFDFAQDMREIHDELAELNQEANALAAQIQSSFKELGV